MTLRKRTGVLAVAIVTTISMTASLATGYATQVDQFSASLTAGERTIVGAWRTRVRPRNCETGEVAPVPGLRGLFSFHEGGTISEYGIGPGSSPALRSPGHGVWERLPGWNEYSYAFTYYRYDANGLFVGSTKVTSALQLAASGDEFIANGTVEVFDATDNLTSTACATAVASRFP